jgi:glycosyltransferase involved in cell wall biosynthesis
MPYPVDSRIQALRLEDSFKCLDSDLENFSNYIRQNKIDVLVGQWASVELCHQAINGTSCKLVVCHHSIAFRDNSRAGSKWKRLVKRALYPFYHSYDIKQQLKEHNKIYAMSDRYIFLSESFVEEYKQRSRNRDVQGKLGFMPNPIALPQLDALPCKEHIVLFVGRIEEISKRISYMLKIWKMVESCSIADNWRFVLAGEGPDLQASKELSKKLGLQRCSFEGFQNPEKYYKSASILMMTSAFEGFGMVLVEAQSYGCIPVAMDSFATLHDIVVNGENGIIVLNNDLNRFSSKLIELIGNEPLRKRMMQNALKNVERFSIDSITERWLSIFQEVVK